VALSLAGYVIVYLIMYPSGLLLILRIIRGGPASHADKDATIAAGTTKAPVLAAAAISEARKP
jgi:cytochrome d ubiquinol oxidase subunit I